MIDCAPPHHHPPLPILITTGLWPDYQSMFSRGLWTFDLHHIQVWLTKRCFDCDLVVAHPPIWRLVFVLFLWFVESHFRLRIKILTDIQHQILVHLFVLHFADFWGEWWYLWRDVCTAFTDCLEQRIVGIESLILFIRVFLHHPSSPPTYLLSHIRPRRILQSQPILRQMHRDKLRWLSRRLQLHLHRPLRMQRKYGDFLLSLLIWGIVLESVDCC